MLGERLQAQDIQVGQPLPFDAYDAQGKLLLRQGYVIDTEAQLERLLAQGLFMRPGEGKAAAAVRPGNEHLSPKAHRVSVLGAIEQVQRELESLLLDLANPQLPARIDGFAAELQRCFRLDADEAIAFVLMGQQGRYAPRRMMQTALLSELLLSQTGADEAARARVLCAALTMNISILDLQDQMWSQATPATPEQEEQLREHPTRAVAMLQALGVSDAGWLALVSQHHETIDGGGYPGGLRGPQISRGAQLLSIADRYGAMATPRSYRPAALPNVVLKQIFLLRDKSVDANLAGLLIKAIGIYPPGTIVTLANGDTAVVVKRTKSANHPIVRSVKSLRHGPLERPRKRNTSEPAYAITGVVPASSLDMKLDPRQLWDEGMVLDN